MTSKPQQRSVAIVGAIRESINGTIDTLLDSLSVQSEQLEQAFVAELAHLDELYTDQENDDTALEQVQRFDKGYAKTMASIQAATERLVEARAHIARITNTIKFHPAFTGNGSSPYAVADGDAVIGHAIVGELDCAIAKAIMQGATPGKIVEIVQSITGDAIVVEHNPLTINNKGRR